MYQFFLHYKYGSSEEQCEQNHQIQMTYYKGTLKTSDSAAV
jgi:hypothetical protein